MLDRANKGQYKDPNEACEHLEIFEATPRSGLINYRKSKEIFYEFNEIFIAILNIEII